MNLFSQKIPPLYSLPLLKGGWGRDFVVGVSVLVFFLLPLIGFAQGYVPLAPLPNTVPEPCNPLNPNAIKPTDAGYKDTCKTGSLPDYLSGLYKLGIGAAGVLAVLMLVWGGFQYTTSEAIQGKSDAKGIIQNVLWGGAVVLGSWLLLWTINPRLVDIGLALTNLRSVTKTRIPSPEETYGKFLDKMLERVQATSQKAQDIKKLASDKRLERGILQQKIDEGNYESDEELAALQSQINELDKEVDFLDTQEVIVRNYENAIDHIDKNTGNMLDCLTGYGSCQRYVSNSAVSRFIRNKVLGGRSEAQLQADEAEAAQFLDGARNDANKRISELRTAGLTARANELQTKINTMADQFARGKDFGRQCDGTIKPMPSGWKSGDSCP